ncbi:MAG: hypothetical protein FJ404_02480 [Verrucomicrobia bacterium]|nr:hypothetical protein [Verrucomicrobiota bacterium]
MSNKDIVKGLWERSPQEASLSDIAQEIEFVAGVRDGLAELDRGEQMTTETLRERVRQWTGSK